MSRCKNTNFFSEIETFFKKNADSAIQARINALKAIRLTGKISRFELPTDKTSTHVFYYVLSNLLFDGAKVRLFIGFGCLGGEFLDGFSIFDGKDATLEGIVWYLSARGCCYRNAGIVCWIWAGGMEYLCTRIGEVERSLT